MSEHDIEKYLSAPKIQKWSNAPRVEDLQNDYTQAKGAHDDQVATIDKWVDFLNCTGEAAAPKRKGRSSINPKFIRKQNEWRYSALSHPFLTTEDLFDGDPVTYEDVDGAKQSVLILNNQWSTKLDKTKFIGDYVRAGVNHGTVIVRTGWKYEDRKRIAIKPTYELRTANSEEELLAVQMLVQEREKDPITFSNRSPDHVLDALHSLDTYGIPVIPVKTGEKEVEETLIIANHPTAELVDYHNFVIDPTCNGELDDARFVIYIFETSLSELRRDGRYTNLDYIQVDSSGVNSVADFNSKNDTSFQFQDKPRKRLIAHEYWGQWDIDNSGLTVPIVATYVQDVMIRLELSPYPDEKIPFVTVPINPEEYSVYGMADAELMIDNQKVIGAVTRGMIDIMGRSAAGQRGIATGTLDSFNRKKYEEGEDYEFSTALDPRNCIIEHKFPEIPQSAQFMLQMQTADGEALSGSRPFAGANGGALMGESATAIRTAMDAASKREADILRRLAAGLVKIGRKFIAMNAEWLSEKEVVRMTNKQFVVIDRNDLASNLDLRLKINTVEEDNQKVERLAFLFQTMGNTVPWDISKFVLCEIAELSKLPSLARNIEQYTPQPDPLAQRKAELEIALLEAEIAEVQSKVVKNNAEAGIKSSAKDKADLDYLEQQTGVTQERELQKMGAQAEANLGLEMGKVALANMSNKSGVKNV